MHYGALGSVYTVTGVLTSSLHLPRTATWPHRELAAPAPSHTVMEAYFGTPIKQHPGQQQVDRAVVVNAPGKFWPGITVAQQKEEYLR